MKWSEAWNTNWYADDWGMDSREFTYCPECKVSSPSVDWYPGEVGCELCGDHAAVFCPHCAEGFDHVWGAETLKDAQKAIV